LAGFFNLEQLNSQFKIYDNPQAYFHVVALSLQEKQVSS